MPLTLILGRRRTSAPAYASLARVGRYAVARSGRKRRPNWRGLVEGRPPNERVFINQRGQPLTRFGVYGVLRACVGRASLSVSSLRSKRISPHTIRHSTATHLLRAGVDLNTIRSWLGHVSLDTTQVYAEIDLEMKARALEKCSTTDVKKPTVASDGALMAFLRAI